MTFLLWQHTNQFKFENFVGLGNTRVQSIFGQLAFEALHSKFNNLTVLGGSQDGHQITLIDVAVKAATNIQLNPKGRASSLGSTLHIEDSEFQGTTSVVVGPRSLVQIETAPANGRSTRFNRSPVFSLGAMVQVRLSPDAQSDTTIFAQGATLSGSSAASRFTQECDEGDPRQALPAEECECAALK